jgi:hypothetical protein
MFLLRRKKLVCLSILFVALFSVILCSQTVLAKGKPDQAAGNCLSMPVIWSDGVTKVLREPPDGIPIFLGEYDTDEFGVNWYLQKDALNIWQAETLDGTAAPVSVTWIDWGDNLEAVDWSERSKVRVEVVLWEDITAAPMNGFEMGWISGQGTDEVWGCNTVVYPSVDATVYSGCARLTIQKLTKDYLDPTLSLSWDAAAGQWLGDANPAQFNGGVWEAADGPGYYSAEINVSGKCMYGYNWNVRDGGEGAGSYRLTFSLEPNTEHVTLNTFFTEGITTIMLPEPEEPEEPTIEAEEPTQGGVAAIDFTNNLTYIDIHITAKTGGGGGGRR